MLRSTKVMDCPQPTPSCGQLTDVTLSGNINGEWENCGGAVTSLFGGKSDHSPKHVHVYREDMIERRIHGPLLEAATGKLLVKWDLDNAKAMKVTPPGESSS